MLMKSGSPAPGVRPLRAFYSSSRCHVIADVPTLHHLPQQFHLSLPKCECGGDTDCGENRTRLPPQPDYPADDHAAREQVLPLAAVFETDGEVALAAADLAGAAPPPFMVPTLPDSCRIPNFCPVLISLHCSSKTGDCMVHQTLPMFIPFLGCWPPIKPALHP